MLKLILNRNLLLFISLFWVIGVNGQSAGDKGLKDFYKGYFPIGVAVTPGLLRDPAAQALILQHFNSLTPENAMKMGPIHPEENRYNWGDADAIVNFAQQHGLKVRGHNLCWHQQTPAWMFRDKDGNLVTKEVLLERLKQHIYAVVGRYKGKIYAWDVVNEAVADENDRVYRNSTWYQICGDDFILKAFQYAHEADPNAILFYNEYGTENPKKRDRVYQLLKKLTDAGAPINAIGLQAHWSLTDPANTQITDAIRMYTSLGIKIQITELDMTVYSNNEKQTTPYTPELEQKQTERYSQLFKLFRDNKQYITGVTFWNLSDRSTWLDNFPVRGRKNYPLLFDQQLKPKKAYDSVVNF
jgi:endo-1,4-beta-xylanase